MGFMGFIGLGAARRPGLWVAGSVPPGSCRGPQLLWLPGWWKDDVSGGAMGTLSVPPHPPCPPLLLLMEGGAAETGVPGGG